MDGEWEPVVAVLRPIQKLIQVAKADGRPTLFRKGVTRRLLAALGEYVRASPLLSSLAVIHNLSFDIHAMRHGGACWLKYEKSVPPEYLTAKADWADDSWAMIDRYTKLIPKEVHAMIELECSNLDVPTALEHAAQRARGATAGKRVRSEPKSKPGCVDGERPITERSQRTARLREEVRREVVRQGEIESLCGRSDSGGWNVDPPVDGKPGVGSTARNEEEALSG